jgi:hypothetical protein
MKQKSIFIILFFILGLTHSYAHQDRIERPQSITFIFQDKDTVHLQNPTKEMLKKYNDDMISNKKQLLEAQLDFETGEKVIVRYGDSHLASIQVNYKNTELAVPSEIVAKIKEIDYHTFALLWNGDFKKAFKANYFYLRFDTGTENSFDKFPRVELHFSGKKFSKATVLKQIGPASQQGSDL